MPTDTPIALPKSADSPLQPTMIKQLQEENLRLKCLVAEQALYIRELEELLSR